MSEHDVELEIIDEQDADDELPMVAASEHDLIVMARALVQPRTHDTWAYLAGTRAMPDAIGPTCEDLLADAFSQLWPALWRRDGARPGASVTDGRVVRGRIWERHAPTPLVFSKAALELLRWLVATPLATGGLQPELHARELTIGDQLLAYLALELADDTAPQLAIARQPLVRAAPLAWLGFAHLMDGMAPAFDVLATGAGAIVVEALGLELAGRWRRVEHAKRTIMDPVALLELGRAQTAALDGFMAACETANRRDLAGFVIDAAAPMLATGSRPPAAVLDATAPLSTRSAARSSSGALLRGVTRWAQWDEQHRGVRFIDDGYDAAQLLLRRFERIGRKGADLAAQWLAELASLAPQAPTPSPGSATIEAP